MGNEYETKNLSTDFPKNIGVNWKMILRSFPCWSREKNLGSEFVMVFEEINRYCK